MIRIVIDFVPGPGGGVNVQGPIHDKVLCLGLLETAKMIVVNHDPEVQRVEVVQGQQAVDLLRNTGTPSGGRIP